MALQMDFKTRTAAVFLQNADFQNCPFVQYSKIDFVCLKKTLSFKTLDSFISI